MDKKYKFSVVMAVYNVKPFLAEAIDSVIAQDIGFENVQLILVDDGSTDGSAEICDQYAAQWFDNIQVIHKENGGVSSARNAGLPLVKGEYVNFLDADDKLSPNAMKEVYAFFEEHKGKTDVVSIPLEFFDGQCGPHMLNYKYSAGSRIIDLNREYNAIQLHINSSFVRESLLMDVHFDEKLSYAEDAKALSEILCKKFRLGVVSTCKYWYRIRSSGGQSALQTSSRRRTWYLPPLINFHEKAIQNCESLCGYVPRFVQYTLAYDLQWRVKRAKVPQGILTSEEELAYKEKLFSLFEKIDDDIILQQKHMSMEHKLLILKKKYHADPCVDIIPNDIVLRYGDKVVSLLSERVCHLEFIQIQKDTCMIEGQFSFFPLQLPPVAVHVLCNGKHYPCELFDRRVPTCAWGTEILRFYGFKVEIPLLGVSSLDLVFECAIGKANIQFRNLAFEKFTPIAKDYATSYYKKDDWLLTYANNGLHIQKSSLKKQLFAEIRFLRELWIQNKEGGRKAVVARCAYWLYKATHKHGYWLISDRTVKAGDNGEAFFRYIRKNHPEIKSCFVLSEDSPDFEGLKAIGPVCRYISLRHKLTLLCSDYILSSQAEEDVRNPFGGYFAPYKGILADKRVVFLQHGVTKDDISSWLNRFNKNLYGFVTAAYPEQKSIIQSPTFYTEKQVWLTGFPRFDRLYHDEKRTITIAPTWRRYLMGVRDVKTDQWSLMPGFEQSNYYIFYNSLINSLKLKEAAQKYGYQIYFFPHPNIQPYISHFDKNDEVTFLGREATYQKVYAESDLLVTDYSSAIFDFVYLRKPIFYAQFDSDEFFSGGHAYTKGYFDYERDGFGEVEYDLDSTIDRIIEYMQNGCKLKDKYRERIDRFFAFNDQNNCQRVYEKIMELEGGQ